MRFGCCVSLGSFVPQVFQEAGGAPSFEGKLAGLLWQVEHLKQVGYDFVEFTVGMVAGPITDEEYRKLKEAVLGVGLIPEAFNSFIPPSIRLVGPDANKEAIREYLERAIPRVAELGGKCIVFGSGGARRVPDGYPAERAEEDLICFLNMAADIALRHDVVIAIEPLNKKESNIINRVSEATRLARRVNRPQIRALADFYHMDEEGEGFESLEDAGALLAHVHVADTGRRYPGSGSYDYQGFFGTLRSIGYAGRISVECKIVDFASETEKALRFMRDVWGRLPVRS